MRECALSLCTYRGGHEYDASFTRTAADFLKTAKP